VLIFTAEKGVPYTEGGAVVEAGTGFVDDAFAGYGHGGLLLMVILIRIDPV
jgi:hypothetical protein